MMSFFLKNKVKISYFVFNVLIICKMMRKIYFIVCILFINISLVGKSYYFYSDSLRTNDKDTTKTIIVVDTLKPLQIGGLINNSLWINKREVDLLDYKYVGNIFNSIPFGFLEDLGFIGQQSEPNLYGLGNNNISYLIDGVEFTNRLQNTVNLYSIQFESIDSVEILKLPHGFLAGNGFNPITINFINRNVFSAKPYTKIRYYQADNEEGSVDFLFHTFITKKLGLRFNLSNSSANSKYTNSDYGSWQASVYAKYFLSNSLNFILGYNYSRIQTRLNGGVDLEELNENYDSSIRDFYIYDRFLAPINFATRYQKNYINNFSIKILAEVLKQTPTEITLYHHNNFTEFRQNENKTSSTEKYIFSNNKYLTSGLNAKQNIIIPKLLNNTFILNMERVKYYADILKNKTENNTISLSGYHTLQLLNNFKPSVFYKYATINNKHYVGSGADLKIYYDNLSFFFGFSDYTKPQTILTNYYSLNDEKIRTTELNINYFTNTFKASASYFIFNGTNHTFGVMDRTTGTVKSDEIVNYIQKDLKYSGVNINFDYSFWIIKVNLSGNYYFNTNDDLRKYSVYGGIYYIDTLFNNNLKLKAGVNIKIVGKEQGKIYDFNSGLGASYYLDDNMQIQRFNDVYSKDSFRADFFVAGKIQDLATVYFVFQNIFDEENYYIPVYPLEARSIRFGFNWELFN